MRKAPSTSVPSGVVNWRSKGSSVLPSSSGQQGLGRLHLGVAVAVLLDDRGVDAERHVVDEEPIVDRGVVDPPFDRVPEGVDAPAGVLTVETEVEGEVVAGAGGDADERDIVLDGDRRDEGLRAVAAGHPQAVGATGDGIAGELLEIEAVVEHHRLDAELVGQLDQTELLDLSTAGPRVADEHRMTGTRDGMGLEGILRVQLPHHGQARRSDRHDEEDQHQRRAEQRPVAVGRRRSLQRRR